MTTKPRFDFYQTDTAVTVSIFFKDAKKDQTDIEIGQQSLKVKAVSVNNDAEVELILDPLFSEVNPATSSFKILSTKIEVVLQKVQPGLRWDKLEASSSQITSSTTSKEPISTTSSSFSSSAPPPTSSTLPTTKSSTSRPKSKWDSLNLDQDEEAKPSQQEADINHFFQQLYADADQDTKRAMMKSYQESGGTTLSTDWTKVGKGRVETKPPDGMVAKKWNQ